ncbi:MAG TPA: polyprenyl synthetase family protein [Dehalococcoidia bacterium]|nr:polyprenyl synthetase family protein [Dehalococcoidia bacterium]
MFPLEKTLLKALEEEIYALLPSLPLRRMLSYPLEGGKRLRPALCLLACRGVGGDPYQALPAAAGVELLHNFSLVHDDIQDASPLRRHRPTVWKRWGVAQAINAGDALFALSRLALLRLEGRRVPAGQVLLAARLLDEATLALCQGQYLDIALEKRPRVSRRTYFRMVRGKTSALLEASVALGAIVGGREGDALEPLQLFGRNLGLAYQLQDDALGLAGAAAVVGKVSPDIRRKKKGFPIVYALEKAGGREGEDLRRLYRKSALAPEDTGRVMALLNRVGALEYTMRLAQGYYDRALRELKKARLPQQQGLEEVVSYLRDRNF